MSAEAVVDRLLRVVNRRISRVAPFRAIVTEVDGGLVKVRPVTATTAGTQLYPSLTRCRLSVNDEVLIANVNGDWVVIDRIRRTAYAAPTFTALAAAGSTATTASSEGDDEAGMIQLVPGGTGITTGTFLDLTFATERSDNKYIVRIQPASSAARTAGATVGPTSRLTTKFSLTTGTALTSGSTYQWFYSVREYEVS